MIGVLLLLLPIINSFQIKTSTRLHLSQLYSIDEEYLEWEAEEQRVGLTPSIEEYSSHVDVPTRRQFRKST